MDDVLLGKASIIERCLARIREDYVGHEAALETDFMRQDAILLNLQRACEAAIDGAMHLVRIHRLGVPMDSRQGFSLLVEGGILPQEQGARLEAMVGFRNIAVHNYRQLDMAIVRAILETRLTDLQAFASLLVQRALPEAQ